jgi:lysophospholipase L1-like esterase
VLFIGDSFIQGMCVTEVADHAINYGIGGDTTAGILARLPIYQSLSRARAVVFAAGDNDLRNGFEESAVVANYQAILSQIPENVPIFFCSLTPYGKSVTKSGEMNQKITRLNHEAKGLCAARANCHFINLSAGLADEEGYLQTQFDDGDGAHLNGSGYRICIDKLHESMAKLSPLALAEVEAAEIPAQ